MQHWWILNHMVLRRKKQFCFCNTNFFNKKGLCVYRPGFFLERTSWSTMVPTVDLTEQGCKHKQLECHTIRYRGTFDVFYKVIKQEGYARLWRGTNASLVLAVPTVGIYLPCYDIFRNWMENITCLHKPELTPYVPLLAGSVARTLACLACSPIELARTRMQAFKSSQTGSKLPGMWTTLLGVLSPGRSNTYLEKIQGYRVLWMGAGAQLARDVPFSAICWSTLEPIRRRLLGMVEDGNAFHVLGANFLAGYVAGSLAAAATCPLDVAKTRRQIENFMLECSRQPQGIHYYKFGGMKEQGGFSQA